MCALIAGIATEARAAEMQGMWLDDTGRAAIRIDPCGDALCGSVEWLKEPNDPATGKPKRDVNNPTASLRNAPLCGLKIMWGFHPDGPGHWTDGKVYDPESGNTYSAEASIEDPSTLRLHGYIWLPVIGRTKLFKRADAPAAPCTDG